MTSKTDREFEIAFILTKRSLSNIKESSPEDFIGYLVDGDLAVRCGERWLAEFKDPELEPWVARRFDLAPVWVFVQDLAEACLRLQHAASEQTVEVEGTPVALRIRRQNGNKVVLDEIFEPLGPEDEALVARFKQDFRGLTLKLENLCQATVDAIDRLLDAVLSANRRLKPSQAVRTLSRLRESLVSSSSEDERR